MGNVVFEVHIGHRHKPQAASQGTATLHSAAASAQGVQSSTRAASQSAASSISARPQGVGWPDQLRPAVKRKPITTASA